MPGRCCWRPGVVDAFPSFAGRDECVGISLFWCIVCDGYEAIGRHVAVVGDDEEAIGTAFGLRHFTDRVTLVTGRRTHPGRSPSGCEALRDRGVAVIERSGDALPPEAGRIRSLTVGRTGARPRRWAHDRRVRDGVRLDAEAPADRARPSPRRTSGRGRLRRHGRRGPDSVTGLYAAGDATAGHSHQVTTAAHLGATAATADQLRPVRPDRARGQDLIGPARSRRRYPDGYIPSRERGTCAR